MERQPILFWGTLVLLLTALASGAVYAFIKMTELPQEPPFSINSNSPNGSYAIKVERKRQETTREDPWTWNLSLSMAERGRQILNNELIRKGDDSSYTGFPHFIVPELTWVNNNTFKLTGKDPLPDSHCDILTVTNNSTKPLSYFTVMGDGDEIFVVDFQPRQSVQLYIQPQSDKGRDFSYLAGWGQFVDSGKIYDGKNFNVRGLYKAPAHYSMTISENGLAISSLEFPVLSPAAQEDKK